MDLTKLKLGKLTKMSVLNFPADIDPGVTTSKAPEVLLYFISRPGDVERFVQTCRKLKLPRDNRVVMIYRKGNKDLNRDTIIGPFRAGHYKDLKLKAPMLCALSDSLSAFVMQKV